MEEPKLKRPRSSNYTEFERVVFVELLARHKEIIDKVKTDSVSLRQKQAAWEKLASEYNERACVTKRTVKQLKDFYDNMKRKKKKENKDAGVMTVPCNNAILPDTLVPASNDVNCLTNTIKACDDSEQFLVISEADDCNEQPQRNSVENGGNNDRAEEDSNRRRSFAEVENRILIEKAKREEQLDEIRKEVLLLKKRVQLAKLTYYEAKLYAFKK